MLAVDCSELLELEPEPDPLDPDPKGSPLPPADVVAATAEPDWVEDPDVDVVLEAEFVTVAIVDGVAEPLAESDDFGAAEEEPVPEEAEVAGAEDEEDDPVEAPSMVPKPVPVSGTSRWRHRIAYLSCLCQSQIPSRRSSRTRRRGSNR